MPRVALIAAFPFPYPQGSQTYVAQQARALAKAGADVTIFTYGCGEGAVPEDLRVLRVSASLSPHAMRSGFAWRKPLADAALIREYVAENRRKQFDFALAHNVEAGLTAIAARPITRVPVVYCAHTLMGHELDAYAAARLRGPLLALGARIDAWIARRADGIVALCAEAAEVLGRNARGPVTVVPPGLEYAAPPSREECESACYAHALEPGAFALYSGNLDGYQDLQILGCCASANADSAWPIIVATHDATAIPESVSQLRVVEVADFREMRALCFAAGALLLTRRRTGGFPVKLLNYMEAARPIIAWREVAPGLRHKQSAWLIEAGLDGARFNETAIDEFAEGGGAQAFALAIDALASDAALAHRLGEGAREHLHTHHDWGKLARATLAFAGEVARGAR